MVKFSLLFLFIGFLGHTMGAPQLDKAVADMVAGMMSQYGVSPPPASPPVVSMDTAGNVQQMMTAMDPNYVAPAMQPMPPMPPMPIMPPMPPMMMPPMIMMMPPMMMPPPPPPPQAEPAPTPKPEEEITPVTEPTVTESVSDSPPPPSPAESAPEATPVAAEAPAEPAPSTDAPMAYYV